MTSLERRLNLGLSLSLLLLILGAWWLGHAALHRSADALVLSRLEHDADTLLANLRFLQDGQPRVAERHLPPVTRRPYSGHYQLLRTPSSIAWRSRSVWDFNLTAPLLPVGERTSWTQPGPDGQELLVWSAGYRRNGQEFTLTLAEDVRPIMGEIRGFEHTVALLALLGFFGMLLIQGWILKHVFALLAPLYRDIDRLEAGATGQLTESVPREFLPLVRKFNGLLAVQSARLMRSRQAAGNLAHALKGPLAVLLRALESDTATVLDRDSARAQCAQIEKLLERELRRARLSGAPAAGAWFDADAELGPLIRLLRQIYADKDLRIDWTTTHPDPLPFDREDMLELLGNLLDNACKWGRSWVRIMLGVKDGVCRIQVEDDGPGCPQPALSKILARGSRLDERTEGHGLGLSIVREILQLYCGDLHIGRSELGGLGVSVSLPLGARELTKTR
ncbi:Sensor protein PhoQ [Thiorhodovibrio winogradskyi]|uniref:histidine kinase n=1 Tax=Thiorhodovibrio winogradskyi TaxID=77007 RepID=A0ABZ0S809_9GAMM|nr:sensor histidine kinase [Thiorhodovibrio winogradskyi]